MQHCGADRRAADKQEPLQAIVEMGWPRTSVQIIYWSYLFGKNARI